MLLRIRIHKSVIITLLRHDDAALFENSLKKKYNTALNRSPHTSGPRDRDLTLGQVVRGEPLVLKY